MNPNRPQDLPAPEPTVATAIVVGTGPVGLAAALALAKAGATVALIGPNNALTGTFADQRTTALFGASIDVLKHLGVWPGLCAGAAPLTGLRLIDDTSGLLRAPELLFKAEETGRDAFGYNVENAALIPALARAVRDAGIAWHPATARHINLGPDRAVVTLDDGSVLAGALVVGADGRQSACRAAMGGRTRAWDYPQTALVSRFSHNRAHHGVSTEFHRRTGPLTTVPLTGDRSSLVWVETPDEAARLLALEAGAFTDALEARLQGLLGSISDVGPRTAFPLAGLVAEPLAGSRVALVGEAAHVMPPIGAQGLNLGFRDVAWLADAVRRVHASGGDIGAAQVTAAYSSSRKGDVLLRSLSVDWLNRSLIAGFMPLDLARRAGLLAVATVPWLRRLAMDGGVGPEAPMAPGSEGHG